MILRTKKGTVVPLTYSISGAKIRKYLEIPKECRKT
jgi:hypothetical protein